MRMVMLNKGLDTATVSTLESVMGSVLDAVVAIDGSGTVVGWNLVAEQVFGWTAEEANGQKLGELIVPHQHRAGHSAGMDRYLKTGRAHVLNRRIEITALDRKGREFPVELSIVQMANMGAPLFIGYLRDISDRHQAAEKLMLSEEALRLATEAAEVGTWDLDLTTNILTWSDRTKAMFGISPEVACSMDDFYAGLHPSDREATTAAFAVALDPSRRATYDATYRTIGREDGLIRWVAAKGRAIFDDSGVCVRAIGTAIDITERNRAAERLKESEGFTRLLLDSATEAFYSVNTEGVTTLCNDAFLKLLGFANEEEVVGRKLHDVIHHSHPDGSHYEVGDCPIYRAAAMGSEPVVVSDEYFFRSDGTAVPVEYRAAPIWDQGVLKGAICTFVDISERRRIKEQRDLLVRELDHRVKNLFAIMSGIVTLSSRSAGSLDEMKAAIMGRLMALAKAHSLVSPPHSGAGIVAAATSLLALLEAVTAPHSRDNADGATGVSLNGPEVQFGGEAVTSLALVFHELATNAAKYGALSTPAGVVAVRWLVENDELVVTWTETGGPIVEHAPLAGGFGSILAERSVVGQLSGKLELNWQPEGLVAIIRVPTERLGA
jgi:PAS domain S-box-containing protein